MKDKNKRIIWFVIFIGLTILTLYTIIKQNSDFSFNGFIDFIATASWQWVGLAFVCMLGFIVFEGLALRVLCKAFGYKKKVSRTIGYSALDVYFSAITPSATGGQPASAYLMMKDEIPGAVTTIILLINLTLYTISIIIIGVICFLARPEIMGGFSTISKAFIIIGFTFQFVLIMVFILLVYKEKIIMKIASGAMKVLSKLHFIRNVEEKQKRLMEVEKQYKECAVAIKNHKKSLALSLGFNFLQRVSLVMVSVCVFLAKGGGIEKICDVFVTQGYVVLGSNSVPIPGSVGVADYLFLDGFSHLVNDPISMELFSRGISFYGCILICGIISLVIYINEGLKGIKQKKNDRVL